MKRACSLAAAGAFLLGAGASPGIPILFDFEDQPDTGTSGAYSSMSITRQGLTMTIQRFGATPSTSLFDFADISSFGPASWGKGSLDPFYGLPPYPNSGPDTAHPFSYFALEFSEPISHFSAEFGDSKRSHPAFPFELGDIDPVGMRAFDKAFNEVDAATEIRWAEEGFSVTGGASDPPGEIKVSGQGIRYISFTSGHPGNPNTFSYYNTLYWDNFRARVPDGGTTAALLGMSLLGLGAAKRATKR